jgi:hypothetical protein
MRHSECCASVPVHVLLIESQGRLRDLRGANEPWKGAVQQLDDVDRRRLGHRAPFCLMSDE